MNNKCFSRNEFMIDPTAPNLLERIISLRATVGDCLSDDELTRLLREEDLPSEDGFTFVSLCQGYATFRVAPQNLVRWYPERGWIAPAKEAIARSIAEKCGFALFEPPDEKFPFGPADSEGYHHLEMARDSETIVIAHPRYLKIRLFNPETRRPLSLPADLLEQLAALYLEHFAVPYRTA